MLTGCKVRAFVATTRPDAARAFYAEALGLPLAVEHDFAMVFEVGEALLHVQKVGQLTAQPFTALGWSVDDIHGTIRDLESRGVVFERFAGMDQDEAGVWTPPGSNQSVAWFKDPDGNLLSLTQTR